MKKATILLAAMLMAGTGVAVTAPPVQAKSSSKSQKQDAGVIKKGMTLAEVEQAVNGTPARVGAPNNGVQMYRLAYHQSTGDGGVNDHPTITIYLFGVKDGKVTWVHQGK